MNKISLKFANAAASAGGIFVVTCFHKTTTILNKLTFNVHATSHPRIVTRDSAFFFGHAGKSTFLTG